MIRQLGQIPESPAMMPAVIVPYPSLSELSVPMSGYSGSMTNGSLVASTPGTNRLGGRSLFGVTPVSRTATVTGSLPDLPRGNCTVCSSRPVSGACSEVCKSRISSGCTYRKCSGTAASSLFLSAY
ncbi:hypothetical protein FB565_004606 [Actinoplanes lutulentus]|uniref:Uncharacterized protein n=1 Tax=Actinoplanes lutulentus TaxID=1287878 RepID=A0A327Z8M3_9ACTN|nr:hypothetical protein [Actinoplanes lutulentus]RAK35335.1 hypothetical protein B0I29_11087 [Actinoplanes lutulentus]